MKKLATCIAAITSFLSVNAHTWECGLLTGASYSSYIEGASKIDRFEGYSIALKGHWEKGIYLRHEEKKIAVNLSYTWFSGGSLNSMESYSVPIFGTGFYHTLNDFIVSASIHQFNLDFQRLIYTKHRLALWGGFNINGDFIKRYGTVKETSLDSGTVGNTRYYPIKDGDLGLRLGLNENIRYSVQKHICISLNFDQSVNPFTINQPAIQPTYSNLGFYGHIAIGYKF